MNKLDAHILVVDDDDGIRNLVKQYLSENNYLITTADSAEDASEKVKVIKFDLLILDIMMPGKNGLEFIQEHKKDLATPIILLTAKGETNERVEGLEIGADDYLPKPFEPKELLLRIKNILDKTKKIDFGSELDAAKAEAQAWKTIWSAGQGVTSIDDVRSTADLVNLLVNEFKIALENQQNNYKKYF